MKLRLEVVALVIALVGATVAHRAQLRVDETRLELEARQELLMMPSGQALRMASSGFHVHLADGMWVRAVLSFGERFATDPDPLWARWFERMIMAITELDPPWRTPYQLGGVMLRVLGHVDESTAVFKRGAENLPDESFFPFAVGMNFYLYEQDVETASLWLREAAGRPDAPKWYGLAAVRIAEQGHSGEQALRFLTEELEGTTDPQLREQLQKRIDLLVHDDYSLRLTDKAKDYEARTGRPLEDPQSLVTAGLIAYLPPDPIGGEWVMDFDGSVISSEQAEARYAKALKQERNWLRYRW